MREDRYVAGMARKAVFFVQETVAKERSLTDEGKSIWLHEIYLTTGEIAGWVEARVRKEPRAKKIGETIDECLDQYWRGKKFVPQGFGDKKYRATEMDVGKPFGRRDLIDYAACWFLIMGAVPQFVKGERGVKVQRMMMEWCGFAYPSDIERVEALNYLSKNSEVPRTHLF